MSTTRFSATQLKWSALLLLGLFAFSGSICPEDESLVVPNPPTSLVSFNYSGDNGDTWQAREMPIKDVHDLIVIPSDRSIFVVGKDETGAEIATSAPGGPIGSWANVTRDPNSNNGFILLAMRGSEIWSAGYNGFAKLVDKTWEHPLLPRFQYVSEVQFAVDDPLLGFFYYSSTEIGHNGHFFGYTSDGGVTWQDADNEPEGQVKDLAVLDQNAAFAATDEGIYRTTDKGKTWDVIEFVDLTSIDVDRVTGTVMGSDGNSLYRSTDREESWEAIEIERLAGDGIGAIQYYPVVNAGAGAWMLGERNIEYNGTTHLSGDQLLCIRKLTNNGAVSGHREILFETDKQIEIKFIRVNPTDPREIYVLTGAAL